MSKQAEQTTGVFRTLRAGCVLLMGLGGLAQGQPTTYTWDAGNGNWNAPANWDPNTGYPGAEDTAQFAGANNTTVTVDTQAADAVQVTGSANWTWNTGTLTLGTLFDYSSSGTSVFNPILEGAGSLTVNAGRLDLTAVSALAGTWTVNAGTLASRIGTGGTAHTDPLDSGHIYLGATGGSGDATLLLSYYGTLNNPITVRSGSGGTARIGNLPSAWLETSPYNIRLYGPVTLQKDVTIRNDALIAIRYYLGRGYMVMQGNIAGTGGLSKEGIGGLQLSGTNSYVGTTRVNGGYVRITSASSSVVGNYEIPLGILISHSNSSGNDNLGDAGNAIALGGPGTFGGFGGGGAAWATVAFNRNVTLLGNGGSLRGRQVNVNLDGVISGGGRLIAASANALRLNNNNTFHGGMDVVDGLTEISPGSYTRTVYGTGDIRVLFGNQLHIRNANNVGPGATILLTGDGDSSHGLRSSLDLWTDFFPTLDPASGGQIMLRGGAAANVNAALAAGASQVGNGYMRLAALSATFSGSSLQANLDGMYRLGSRSGVMTLNAGAGARGVLTGANAVQVGHHYSIERGMDGRGIVSLVNSNDFTGAIIVNRASTLQGTAQPTAGTSPFGSSTGAVELEGGTLELLGASGGQAVMKGGLTIDGSARVTLTASDFSPQLTVAELIRSGCASLRVGGTDLGNTERFLITTGVPAPVNGMTAPWIVGAANGGQFLAYNAGTGFAPATTTATTLAGAGANDVVTLAATESVPSGKQVYALNTAVAVTGSEPLTVGSGGLILSGAQTHSAPFAFGSVDAVVYASANNILSGPLTGSGGLTKFGPNEVRLTGDNTGLTGGIQVNEGILGCTVQSMLGSNAVTLNGGSLYFYQSGTSIFTNDLVLGKQGGLLRPGAAGITVQYDGNISGTGALTTGSVQIRGTNNTYSGGTYFNYYSGYAGGSVAENSSLGTGPVTVMSSSDGSAGGNAVFLELNGNNNLYTNALVTLTHFSSALRFHSANPRMGSLQGNGQVVLGHHNPSINAALTLGLDNRSTEFFGTIHDAHTDRANSNNGRLIKAGTGTFTLWGENTYSGGTVVSNGTLVVNNWLTPDSTVSVLAGATLDGNGTVGAVTATGGTVRGNLWMRELHMDSNSTLAVTLSGTDAGSQYGQLNVEGDVTLDGTLQVSLGFAPVAGQTFTILNGSSVSGGFITGGTVTATYGEKTYALSVEQDGASLVLTALSQGSVILVR